MKAIKNRNRKKGSKKLPRARRLRSKRKVRVSRPARKRSGAPGVRGKGAPIRNVRGLLAVIMPGERKAIWGNRCCATCVRVRAASMSVTWEYWHRGEWRSARRFTCGKHGDRLKARLLRARREGAAR